MQDTSVLGCLHRDEGVIAESASSIAALSVQA
jgi:hypothetical protein